MLQWAEAFPSFKMQNLMRMLNRKQKRVQNIWLTFVKWTVADDTMATSTTQTRRTLAEETQFGHMVTHTLLSDWRGLLNEHLYRRWRGGGGPAGPGRQAGTYPHSMTCRSSVVWGYVDPFIFVLSVTEWVPDEDDCDGRVVQHFGKSSSKR